MSQIFDAVVENERLRLMLRHEHAFGAGYDIALRKDMKIRSASSTNFIGLKGLPAFHLNDSIKDFNSRVDRHQHIGKGFIGLDAFAVCSTTRDSSDCRCAWRRRRDPR